MATSLSFTVHGTPKPKGSARGFIAMKAGKARAIVTSDNKNLKAWETAVRFVAQEHAGTVFFTEAVSLYVAFFFQRPKSVSERKRPFLTTKPDLSKLIRGLEDALTGVLWKDDSQVVSITSSKAYASAGQTSHAYITITEIERT